MLCTIQPSGVVFEGVLERKAKKLFVHQEMGNNSKNKREVVKTFQLRGRPSLFEDGYQTSCESNKNWGSYVPKETTYFKKAFLQAPPLKWCY